MANSIRTDESYDPRGSIGAALRGVAVGILATALPTLIFTAIALASQDPEGLIAWLAYAALFIGAFACGIASMRFDPDHGLLTSVIGGVGYALILWLISLFFRANAENAMPPIGMIIGYAGCIAVSLAGGLIARPRRTRIDSGKKSPAALVRGRLGRR